VTARHLLALEGMSRQQIEACFSRAAEHLESAPTSKPLAGKLVANLFFEPSTRTRSSFEAAAKALGAEVLNWTVMGSSASKGETLLDTVRNIAALGPFAIVLRHQASGAAAFAAANVPCSVVNAGDGRHEHPSQGLLDTFTLWRRWKDFRNRRVAIVGDVLHSRVARSNLHALKTLGATVTFCGPRSFVPHGWSALGVQVDVDFDRALEGADAVMVLRVQKERMDQAYFANEGEYHRRWGLTVERGARLKADAVVMHPGPVNRGVEIAAEIADGPRSLILEQVRNGVFIRMAILEGLTR
jgi:aspartate carbamoyltransferase catalytic subunit